jgi:predicted dehydrogenase
MTSRSARLRVAILGASHWHFDNYAGPLAELDDVAVVAVADPDALVAQRRAEQFEAEWSADFRDVCERTAPDFAIALGRHCDMLDEGTFLLERGIPFAMEKPCGLNASEVARLSQLAEQRGAFVAVPFVWRLSDFMDAMRRHVGDEHVDYVSLRIVSGHPDRYEQAGCSWMLDPALSGGGTTINLTVHLIDLFRQFTGVDRVRLAAAQMGNASFGLEIEDHSLLVMDTNGSSCLAETGFLFPAPTGTYDVQFMLKTSGHYVRSDVEKTEIMPIGGPVITEPTEPANWPTYALFVGDCVRRLREDAPPLAGLADMADVMSVVDRAYDVAWPAAARERVSVAASDAKSGRDP